jgi:hypothetical protein
MPDNCRGPVDERHLGPNDHGLHCFGNCQVKVTHHPPTDIDVQRLDTLGAKACRLRGD